MYIRQSEPTASPVPVMISRARMGSARAMEPSSETWRSCRVPPLIVVPMRIWLPFRKCAFLAPMVQPSVCHFLTIFPSAARACSLVSAFGASWSRWSSAKRIFAIFSSASGNVRSTMAALKFLVKRQLSSISMEM